MALSATTKRSSPVANRRAASRSRCVRRAMVAQADGSSWASLRRGRHFAALGAAAHRKRRHLRRRRREQNMPAALALEDINRSRREL